MKNKNLNKKRFLKIALPILIVLLIAFIVFNSQSEQVMFSPPAQIMEGKLLALTLFLFISLIIAAAIIFIIYHFLSE